MDEFKAFIVLIIILIPISFILGFLKAVYADYPEGYINYFIGWNSAFTFIWLSKYFKHKDQQ